MATEEQTSGASYQAIGKNGPFRAGQKLTISNRMVSKLAFKAYLNILSPIGNVTFTIRKVSDDSIMASKVWGDAADFGANQVWREVTFDSAVQVNEEVRILCEYAGTGNGDYIRIFFSTDDVKADEYYTRWITDYTEDQVGWDATYSYTFTGGSGSSPTVTTQATTSTIAEKTFGHGNLLDFGDSAVTQHGHCWSTSINPTTALSTKTTNGAAAQLGQFASLITNLTPGTLYYFRAYATNTAGTSYGANVTTTAGSTIGRRHIWIEGRDLHYFDEYGTERKLEGLAIASGLPWWYF